MSVGAATLDALFSVPVPTAGQVDALTSLATAAGTAAIGYRDAVSVYDPVTTEPAVLAVSRTLAGEIDALLPDGQAKTDALKYVALAAGAWTRVVTGAPEESEDQRTLGRLMLSLVYSTAARGILGTWP